MSYINDETVKRLESEVKTLEELFQLASLTTRNLISAYSKAKKTDDTPYILLACRSQNTTNEYLYERKDYLCKQHLEYLKKLVTDKTINIKQSTNVYSSFSKLMGILEDENKFIIENHEMLKEIVKQEELSKSKNSNKR